MGCLDDLSHLFAPIFFLTWFGLLSLQGRLFDASAHPCLELLGGFTCFAINTILWMLAALFFIFPLWVTDLAIGWALRVPSYVRQVFPIFQIWVLYLHLLWRLISCWDARSWGNPDLALEEAVSRM
jgi:hypothetical protein